MTKHEQQWIMMEHDMAVKSAQEWMDKAIDTAERQVRDLKRYRADFDEALTAAPGERIGQPVDVLGWFANQTQWAVPNMNLGNLPNVAVRLEQALAKAKVVKDL